MFKNETQCVITRKKKEQILEELMEVLSAYAHEAWSGWMRYMFGKCDIVIEEPFLDGDKKALITMPHALFERWTRQMRTPYADLPEEEKNSYRAEALKMLALLKGKLVGGG